MKRTGTKRLAAASLALALTFALPMQAFAATWYLDEGDITITATETEQSVSQNDKTELDDDPVITQKDSSTATGNTITVETEGKAEAVFTIKDVNIDTSERGDDGKTGGPAIEIGDSKADITFSGDNILKSDDSAAIHVSGGSVILKEDDETDTTDTLTVEAGGYSAGIGTDMSEHLSGSITIESGIVEATGTYFGAGIGTGVYGGISGEINISGGEVTGTSIIGAGIGTGAGFSAEGSELSGSINITGGTVTGKQDASVYSTFGAGIGTGYMSDLSGSINITGGTVTGEARSDTESGSPISYGAGIGTGTGGDLSGSINISGGTVTGIGQFGSGIGTGTDGSTDPGGDITSTGSINISGGNVSGTSEKNSAGIGTGDAKEMAGSINITGGNVVGASEGLGAGVGAGYWGEISGTVRVLNNAEVDVSEGGVGCGSRATDNGNYYMSTTAKITGAETTTFNANGEYTVVSTAKATCETAGSVTYKNETTGDSYTVYIPATGHTYEAKVTYSTDSTQGYVTYEYRCVPSCLFLRFNTQYQ